MDDEYGESDSLHIPNSSIRSNSSFAAVSLSGARHLGFDRGSGLFVGIKYSVLCFTG